MSASTTPRTPRFGERQKGGYRLLVLVLLALCGPLLFGMGVGLLSVGYSVGLVVYAFWAMRLSVLFDQDANLGLILCLLDVMVTLPLIFWGGTESWFAIGIIGLWTVDVLTSVRVRSHLRAARLSTTPRLADPVTGFYAGHRLPAAFDVEAQIADTQRLPFALVTIRVLRYDEMRTCFGGDAADRALSSLSRRARHELGAEAEGYRLSGDTLALLVPAWGPAQTAQHAAALCRAVNSRLIDGRRVDSMVGHAVFPRDGRTLPDLMVAAEVAQTTRGAARTIPAEGTETAVGQGRVAVASSFALLS